MAGTGRTSGRKSSGNHDITDPRKKLKSTANESKRGQQLSDKRIKAVASGKMSYEAAMAKQKADDAKVSKIKQVGKKVKGSSQNTESKRKYSKAKFKIDRHGNKVAY